MEPETQNHNQPGEKEKELGTFEALSFFVFDFLKVFVVAVAIIVPVRYFLFQPFVVTGNSMLPNFHDGDYLIIDEISYRMTPPEHGEVVVMRYPNDPSQFFIKRIVALPGERIAITDGHVMVYNKEHPQGHVYDESYLPQNDITYGNIDKTLGQDEFFVLGDNRLSSSDSRSWGILPRKDIIGRVYLRLFPFEKVRLFIPYPDPAI